VIIGALMLEGLGVAKTRNWRSKCSTNPYRLETPGQSTLSKCAIGRDGERQRIRQQVNQMEDRSARSLHGTLATSASAHLAAIATLLNPL
jgi:hypothetical protein